MTRETGVAVCQLALAVGDVEGNVARAAAAVRTAVERGAEVVVLPELVTTGYVFRDAAELRAVAEPVDGPATSTLVQLSAEHGVVLVAGVAERVGDEVFNSAVVAERGAVSAVYRKAHLWDTEIELFRTGADPPPVVETAVGRVAVCVCYDLEFPEWTRLAGLAGADLLCAPTNWPASPRPPGERAVEVVRAQATASVDRMFVAVCDRVGTERGVKWVGGSAVIGPDGYPLVVADRPVEQVLVARCDLSRARDKATSSRNAPDADRRPELYAGVTEPCRPRPIS